MPQYELSPADGVCDRKRYSGISTRQVCESHGRIRWIVMVVSSISKGVCEDGTDLLE
ncbi:hypothetical protein [Neorhodopirellula pilleata]|uniref:hypothetical protein n=1 Tax=Neorhodopirellula pilleata TaxID=2714738 RepID=UPI0018CF2F81|nr:hypothetical protein [Neorhodopirellula pilleata]